MIDSRELRIGNFVMLKGIPLKIVSGIQIDMAYMNDPIPLTPEILLANGWERCNVDGYGFLDILIRQNNEGKLFYYPNRLGIELTFVHQLQNLIFCLTDKEWDLNL